MWLMSLLEVRIQSRTEKKPFDHLEMTDVKSDDMSKRDSRTY